MCVSCTLEMDVLKQSIACWINMLRVVEYLFEMYIVFLDRYQMMWME